MSKATLQTVFEEKEKAENVEEQKVIEEPEWMKKAREMRQKRLAREIHVLPENRLLEPQSTLSNVSRPTL